MGDEHRYVDDFFFVEAGKTVETPYTNRVRYAQISKGLFVNKIVQPRMPAYIISCTVGLWG